MTRATLLALASRVEAMRGPTCVVDVEIAIAVGYAGENSEGARDIRADPDDDGWLLFEMAGEACECCNRAPPYTSSLDAAMSLYITIPERIPSNPRLATAEALRQRAIAGSMTE